MSKTTLQQINRPVRVDEENRFDLAGRLLAHAGLLEAEGERHDAGILAKVAAVVATEGPEYARGWIQGGHYFAGVRIHDPWMIASEVLEVPRRWTPGWDQEVRVARTQEEIHGEVRDSLLRQIQEQVAGCDSCGSTTDHHHPG